MSLSASLRDYTDSHVAEDFASCTLNEIIRKYFLHILRNIQITTSPYTGLNIMYDKDDHLGTTPSRSCYDLLQYALEKENYTLVSDLIDFGFPYKRSDILASKNQTLITKVLGNSPDMLKADGYQIEE